VTAAAPSSDRERIIQYFETAGLDYSAWSPAFNMHFGYWRMGMNPLNLEGMLDQMNEEVYRRLDIDGVSDPLVLDLGCGLGTVSRYMARRHATGQFRGLTVTPWQVDFGTRLTREAELEPRVVLFEGDYTDPPFPPESADGAFAIESACYARGRDKRDFIEALYRVLKPGARFAVADCFRANNRPMPGVVQAAYRRCCACWALECMAEIGPMEDALADTGFEAIVTDDISWNVAPSVAHVPWTELKFLARLLWRGELRHLDPERRNNALAPFLGILLGMCRSHFRYCIVSGRKPEAAH
jgi:SAM-dependent methyltransferase